jgi:uncharacterized RDD family membrane protein YckC
MKPPAEKRRQREVVTPEGVVLSFPLADVGERISALFIDLLIILAAGLGVALVIGLSGSDEPGSLGQAAGALIMFFLRSFYFLWFELRWQGQTPGKRVMKIRVIDAGGGPLTADAIIARNLMRSIELFLPLSVMITPEMLWPSAPRWASIGAGGWAVIVLLMPLFNRERARVGDLVAGTRVASVPRALLLPDLAADRDAYRIGKRADAKPTFSAEQLDVYGAYEVQVLADLLRGNTGTTARELEAAQTACESIRRKIRWTGPAPFDALYWLEEFYAAQRAHLERKMLFGVKKADKNDR